MDLATIQEKVNKLGTDMSAITAKAAAENREMTDAENESFDAMHKDFVKAKAAADRLRFVSELETGERRTAPTQPSNETRRAVQPATEEQRRALKADRLEAWRGWLLGGKPGEVKAESRAAAQRVGISLEQPQMLIRLPEVALRSLDREDIKAWEERIVADVVSPDLGGHFTIPDESMRELEIALLSFGGMRQVANVIRTNTGAALPQPTTNDTSNEGALLGEGLEHTELDITFSQLVLESYKYTSRRVMASVEYLQDNAVNAAQVIGRLLGERIARITNRHFTVGTGSAQPNGIVTAATLGVTGASQTAITFDELIDLEHSVDPAYRQQNARFMFHDDTLKAIKKINDPTTSRPIWMAGLASREPDTILGYPYTINQHMESMTSSPSPNRTVLFGALGKYLIRDVRDITLVRLDERYAELGMVAFLAFSRHDGDLLDAGTNPVKYLSQA